MPGAISFGFSPPGSGVVEADVGVNAVADEVVGVATGVATVSAVADGVGVAAVGGAAGARVAGFGGAVAGADTPRGTSTANPTTITSAAAGTDQRTHFLSGGGPCTPPGALRLLDERWSAAMAPSHGVSQGRGGANRPSMRVA